MWLHVDVAAADRRTNEAAKTTRRLRQEDFEIFEISSKVDDVYYQKRTARNLLVNIVVRNHDQGESGKVEAVPL